MLLVSTSISTYIVIYRIASVAPAAASNGSSWFGRLFRRSDNTPTGPIKANLGEEKSLYYDKELKRWINTKVILLVWSLRIIEYSLRLELNRLHRYRHRHQLELKPPLLVGALPKHLRLHHLD